MRRMILLAATSMLAACAANPAGPPVSTADAAPVAAPAEVTPDQQLAAFFVAVDNAQLDRSPLSKAYRGIRDDDYGDWDDFSDNAEVIEQQAREAALTEMRQRFADAALSDESRLSYRLFEKLVERQSDAFKYHDNDYVFDQMNGAQSQLPAFLINIHRVSNKAEAEAYVSRLNGLGAAIDQLIAVSAKRAQAGVAPPKWVYPYVISDARNVITGFPFTKIATEAPLYADFKAKVTALDLPQAEKDALIMAAGDALIANVRPAYLRLIAEMERQERFASTDDGVWRFPDGAEYYAERLRNYTTTNLTADQIHAIGLAQVDRIHNEMRDIMAKVGFTGSLQDFFVKLRDGKEFFQPNTDAGRQYYLDETEKAKAAVTALLPQWFGVLPQAPLVVKRVEAFREKSAGKAFYQSPAPDGSRPGTYYVNLYDMKDMPTTEIDVLFYHEGLPGHHLQRTIQTELKGVPPFRQFGGVTAYSEGWGLYSEKLAKEMGLYTDPYRDFGRLALELHRAIRLVVDTGIHSKKWTRERAIRYVVDNSPDTEGSATKAIERYIIYPGQATAYMIGKLKIEELREKARAAMGDRFDIRAFHDLVLKSGPVPLDVLEERVAAWSGS